MSDDKKKNTQVNVVVVEIPQRCNCRRWALTALGLTLAFAGLIALELRKADDEEVEQ